MALVVLLCGWKMIVDFLVCAVYCCMALVFVIMDLYNTFLFVLLLFLSIFSLSFLLFLFCLFCFSFSVCFLYFYTFLDPLIDRWNGSQYQHVSDLYTF